MTTASELMSDYVRRQYDYQIDLAMNTIPRMVREINELRHARGVDDYPSLPFNKTDEEYVWLRAVLRDEKALDALRADPEMQAFQEWRNRKDNA